MYILSVFTGALLAREERGSGNVRTASCAYLAVTGGRCVTRYVGIDAKQI